MRASHKRAGDIFPSGEVARNECTGDDDGRDRVDLWVDIVSHYGRFFSRGLIFAPAIVKSVRSNKSSQIFNRSQKELDELL